MSRPRVLVIEDGREYTQTLRRFLGGEFEFCRAGDGREALSMLEQESFHALFLDMRFDRVGTEQLFGELDAISQRFSGNMEQARLFLEDNQGTYILARIRASGCSTHAVFSYDFDSEPKRWRHLQRAAGPVSYLTDNASPDEIRKKLLGVMR